MLCLTDSWSKPLNSEAKRPVSMEARGGNYQHGGYMTAFN